MIAQRYTISDVNTMVTFGNGDIAISGKVANIKTECGKEQNFGIIDFTEMNDPQDVGSSVPGDNTKNNNSGVSLAFSNTESIDVLIQQLRAVKKTMKDVEKNNRPKFKVKMKDIIVDPSFQRSRPLPEKIMKCYNTYKETGDFGKNIFVSPNLLIQDGYVAYLVAEYENLEEVEVIALEGIKINLNGVVVTFMDNNVKVDVEEKPDGGFSFKINDNEIPVKDMSDADAVLKKISSVFKPLYTATSKPISGNMAGNTPSDTSN